MIYCVWYPSGGFGQFVNSVLNLYGDNFVRPNNNLVFSPKGDSHKVNHVAPGFYRNQQTYDFEFNLTQNYSIVIDNGINDESTRFVKFFPDAKIIKLCYTDFSWPIVALRLFVKAMESDLSTHLPIDHTLWDTSEDWAIREKYFLFLRDSPLRSAWKPDSISTPLQIDDLLDYNTMRNRLGVQLNDFNNVWQQWKLANQTYIEPILTAQQILNGNFKPVSDLWTQAVVYYQIWCKYQIEPPHNDYSNWFESYDDIVTMLNNHGVIIDSN